MSPYIIGTILIGVIATVIAGAFIAVNIAKIKFADNPPMFNIARIGIIWAAFIVILAMGTIFTSSVVAALQANRGISTMILIVLFVIAMWYALRQKSLLIAVLTTIVGMGVVPQIWPVTIIYTNEQFQIAYDLASDMFLILYLGFGGTAIMVIACLCAYYCDKSDKKAQRAAEAQARAEAAQTEAPTAPGHRVVWRRVSPTAMAPVEVADAVTAEPNPEGQNSGEEFVFKQNNRGYGDTLTPRPHEPTLQ